MIWAYVFLELDEKAPLTHENVQWIKGLHLVQLLWPQVAFAEGRHAKIYERVAQCGLAEPTSTRAISRCGLHVQFGGPSVFTYSSLRPCDQEPVGRHFLR